MLLGIAEVLAGRGERDAEVLRVTPCAESAAAAAVAFRTLAVVVYTVVLVLVLNAGRFAAGAPSWELRRPARLTTGVRTAVLAEGVADAAGAVTGRSFVVVAKVTAPGAGVAELTVLRVAWLVCPVLLVALEEREPPLAAAPLRGCWPGGPWGSGEDAARAAKGLCTTDRRRVRLPRTRAWIASAACSTASGCAGTSCLVVNDSVLLRALVTLPVLSLLSSSCPDECSLSNLEDSASDEDGCTFG